jgi:hypothetical protein
MLAAAPGSGWEAGRLFLCGTVRDSTTPARPKLSGLVRVSKSRKQIVSTLRRVYRSGGSWMVRPLRIRRCRRARSNGRVRFAFRIRSPAYQPLQFCLDRPPDTRTGTALLDLKGFTGSMQNLRNVAMQNLRSVAFSPDGTRIFATRSPTVRGSGVGSELPGRSVMAVSIGGAPAGWQGGLGAASATISNEPTASRTKQEGRLGIGRPSSIRRRSRLRPILEPGCAAARRSRAGRRHRCPARQNWTVRGRH